MRDLIFYYRLSEHEKFLKECNIIFEKIMPRMSRDFLEFNTNNDAKNAEIILKNAFEITSKIPVFEEVDNRGKNLFVTFTYSKEIDENTTIQINNKQVNLKDHVNFVAIKNAKHSSNGYLFIVMTLIMII